VTDVADGEPHNGRPGSGLVLQATRSLPMPWEEALEVGSQAHWHLSEARYMRDLFCDNCDTLGLSDRTEPSAFDTGSSHEKVRSTPWSSDGRRTRFGVSEQLERHLRSVAHGQSCHGGAVQIFGP
jgi:hypothetical protein